MPDTLLQERAAGIQGEAQREMCLRKVV